MVGTAETTSGSDGFLWSGAKLIDLGASFFPSGINDSGEIAGNCASGPCVRTGNKLADLPDPAGQTCGAESINNAGDVLGGCANAASDELGAIWENGTPIDLGTLGGPQTGVAGMNNLGQVVGWSQTSSDADDPFLWSEGKMTDLGVRFFPAAINDNGLIVGDQYLYSNGQLQDLNTMIPAGSPQIDSATAINDSGQILAQAAGDQAVLLTPN